MSVLIADVPSPVRDVLVRALTSSEVTVSGVASSVTDIVAMSDGVDVVVLGDRLRAQARVGVVGDLLARKTRVLLVSSGSLDDSGAEFLLAGASGALLLEDLTPEALVEAVVSVAEGHSSLHPTVARIVLDHWRAQRSVERRSSVELTAREREVLVGLRDGLTTRLLAKRLGVAEKTVEAHRSRLYAKLGARNQAHALAIAFERDMLGGL